MSELVHLAVIAKAPVPGLVKTRLCPPCTEEEAAAIAEAALADTLDVVLDASASRRTLVLDGEPGPWVPHGIEIMPQGNGTLAQRLRASFEACFAICPDPVIMIAMDTPQVSVANVEAVAQRLTANAGPDAVLGPADDGGYWLVGLRHLHPEVFTGVPMSTNATLTIQRQQMERCGYRVALGEQLLDFDDFAQAFDLAQMVPDSRFAKVVSEASRAMARRRQPDHPRAPQSSP